MNELNDFPAEHHLPLELRARLEEKLGGLPVFPHLQGISEALRKSPSRALVLTAETGAGKSTAVPFALLDSFAGKTLVLEPRRLAALAIANYAAELSATKTGGLCGYRMHLESCAGKSTRLEVLTEAVLLRMLQSDPALEGVSCVVLDEFHERSVYADTALAFLKEVQTLRDDLFVLVMSASIDAQKICEYLQCECYSVAGRLFPVQIEYAEGAGAKPNATAVDFAALRRAALDALQNEDSGSVLVFLPGIAEIRRAQRELEPLLRGFSGVELHVLHSSVPFAEQRKVLEPPPQNTRRLILSSSVAETSLTVPAVRTVIDCGLSRLGQFDPNTGMNHLVTQIESEFSAIQRAGRAGRLASGRCIRLWSKFDPRAKETLPEILRTDLMPLVLECASWGAFRLDAVEWLSPPPLALWNTAVEFLTETALLEKVPQTADSRGSFGALTPLGRAVLGMGVSPRVALVALEGSPLALDYAVRYSGAATDREEKRLRQDLQKKLSQTALRVDEGLRGSQILLAGFFDRLARHCGGGVYQFPGGRQAKLSASGRENHGGADFPPWVVAPEVDAGDSEGKIYKYEAVEGIEAWLEKHSSSREETFFVEGTNKLRKVRRTYFGKILLAEQSLKPEPEDAKRAYCALVREKGLGALPWNAASEGFAARVRFFAAHCVHGGSFAQGAEDGASEASDFGAALLEGLEEWLAPFLAPDGSLGGQLFLEALRYKFNGAEIDRAVPARLKLQNGREFSVKYEETDKRRGPEPVIEAVIQQVFGCTETPQICGVPVTLRLLSPARRPLQVTRDLANFWQNTWPEICKEMRGRYPKHNWDAATTR